MTCPTPASHHLEPGKGFTIFGELLRDIPRARHLIELSDIVTLHTNADPTDVTAADAVRAIRPAARMWLALPLNRFARMTKERAVAEMRLAARVALRMRVEVLELNGEGASDPDAKVDWTGSGAELVRLSALVEALVAVIREEAPSLVVVWTSHDRPSFALPWPAVLRLVDYHAPQHYPSEKGRTVKLQEMIERVAGSKGRWEPRVEAGSVPAEMIPGGERCTMYAQGWGMTLAATCWALDHCGVARLWAFPNSWAEEAPRITTANGPQDVGHVALRVMRAVTDEVGAAAGAVARWQREHGLDPDGVVGKDVLQALGIVARAA